MKRYMLALIEVPIEGHKMDAPDIVESADGPLCKFSDHASEVREKDELIQRLCDSVQRKIDRMSCDSLESEGTDFLKSFGLRMVGGTWEKVK